MNWIHKLLNPHCKDCKFEKEQERINNQNDLVLEYKEMLSSARLEIGRLTQALVDLSKPPEVVNQIISSDAKPLPRKMRISEVAARMTKESHDLAMELKKKKEVESANLRNNEISEMEAKLGIN